MNERKKKKKVSVNVENKKIKRLKFVGIEVRQFACHQVVIVTVQMC